MCGLAPIRRSPFGARFGQFRNQAAAVIEQFFGLVAFHPGLKLRDMFRMVGVHEQRHLMRAKRALDLQAIDNFGSRPALGRPKDDHRPTRSGGVVPGPGVLLDLPDVADGLVQGRGHELMHCVWIITFHEVGRPAAALEKLLQFLMLDPGQDSGVADLDSHSGAGLAARPRRWLR